MDEIKKILQKYGFVYKQRLGGKELKEKLVKLRKEYKYAEIDKKMTSGEAILYKVLKTMGGVGELKIADFAKMYELCSIPEKFNEIKPICQDIYCVRVVLYSQVGRFAGGVKNAVYGLGTKEQVGILKEYMLEEFKNHPEKYGMNKKEIKLKKMFNDEVFLSKETERMAKLYRELHLLKKEEINEKIREMVREIKKVLKNDNKKFEKYF